ncbi:NADP-dependent oxidoreductase [Agrobacterium sp. a22-2]|uniref:NADP-dependent oxidoreductase n=1 Tax=Agrobacterium sp. a22-2 TaxID=2283840 RepID=UPI001445BED5|nr:NADP-dependent oxidoreductase [Agrobacterium sp. a22-2]NKN39278.1 NADP-dependent oxidoreductase [Agrobacterium sp. a22-2]
MKACFYRAYGGPEVLQYGDLPDPVLEAGQVLVRLSAASVAPLDWKLRAGLLQAHFTPGFPKIPGRDGTGTIIALGPESTDFAIGDRVCVMAPPPLAAGTYAERIACNTINVVKLPDAISMEDGAAVVNSGLSAWISAVRTADIKPGQKVLVHSGAGAVGGLLVQFCRHLGADVTTTCRDGNQDYVLSLGASRAIAYDRDDFTTIEPQDTVFDLVGGAVHDRSYTVLKPGGHLVWLTALPIVDRGEEFGVRVSRAMISDDGEAVSAMLDLVAKGIIRPQISHLMPLAEAREAQTMMAAGTVTRGRIVLQIP